MLLCKLIVGSFLIVTLGTASAQCEFFTDKDLLELAKLEYKDKAQKLNQSGAVVKTSKGYKPNCQYRTYVRCKKFISDEKWHWSEIITFNACDNVITYSTSDRENFRRIVGLLRRRASESGKRAYDNLEFTLFEGQDLAFETNVHPNEEGVDFYLLNLLRTTEY